LRRALGGFAGGKPDPGRRQAQFARR
jgi:hypothetical protein